MTYFYVSRKLWWPMERSEGNSRRNCWDAKKKQKQIEQTKALISLPINQSMKSRLYWWRVTQQVIYIYSVYFLVYFNIDFCFLLLAPQLFMTMRTGEVLDQMQHIMKIWMLHNLWMIKGSTSLVVLQEEAAATAVAAATAADEHKQSVGTVWEQ